MRPVLTPAEMGEADRRVIAAGTPESVLVERAGRAVAWEARRMLGGTYGRRVVVVCGKGNNGADGRVAAATLRSWGARVDEFPLGGTLDRDAFRRALARSHLAVDAMFGTGFRGALEGEAEWVADTLRLAATPVLAVDIPSGVDGLTGAIVARAVRADVTVCFAALKPGLLLEPGRTHAGAVHVVDIGIDAGEPATGASDAGDARAVMARSARLDPRANKWSSGVLVVGGSRGMTGAPLLAGRAAARTGAGMVVVAVPGDDAAATASGSELVVRALAATPEGGLDSDAGRIVVRDVAPRFRAVVVGPGLGRDDRTIAAVHRVVAEVPVPLVVDADGLNALAVDPSPLRVRHAAGLPPALLTPHDGEYARLAGDPVGADRVGAARRLAERTRAIVLLKGPGTVVADPSGCAAITPIGGPELAAAGTGDVLSGILGALLAFGADPFRAATAGAWLHARAAAVAGTGTSLVASDLLGALGPTLSALADESPED